MGKLTDWLERMAEKRTMDVEETVEIEPQVEEPILRALLGEESISRQDALKIPALNSSVNTIANMIASIPIKLYRREPDGSAEEVREDPRLRLLNDETGDTLTAKQMWKAAVVDRFLGKGGYIYINRARGEPKSLHYVKEEHVQIIRSPDVIFKDYDILVQGKRYYPFDFIKILRNTRDGAAGEGLISDSELILQVLFSSLKFERGLVERGGNKKGFIQAARKLTEDAIRKLKSAWKKMYTTSSDNVVILNEGLNFKEASNTSVEMQLNENKLTNSKEIYGLTGVPEKIITGSASGQDSANFIKAAVNPILEEIASAVNRELLLESEKGSLFFAHDTTDVLKGDVKSRYEAYKMAIDGHFLTVDEVRIKEKLPPTGMDFIKLGLDSVLFDTESKQFYVPNTDRTYSMGATKEVNTTNESGNQS